MAESRDVSSAEYSDQVGGRQAKDCETCRNRNKRTVAVWFCKTCDQYQCEECSKMHEVFNFMFGHEIDLIKPEEALSLKRVFDMKGLDKCKDHDKLFEFYCIDHRKLLCSTCAIAKHRGCVEVNEIASENAKHSGNTSDLQNVIQELQETANNISKLMTETKSETHKKLDIVLNHLEDTKNNLLTRFDQLKASVTEQFRCEEEKQIQMINSGISTTEKISESLRQQNEFLVSAKSGGTAEQVFIAEQLVESQITPYRTILEKQRSSLYTLSCSVECSGTILELLKSDARLVSLASFKIDKVFVTSAEKDIQPTRGINAPSSFPDKVIQIRLANSVILKQNKDDTRGPVYSGMDYFSDGRLVVVDNFNMKLNVINENLERKGVFKFSGHRLAVCVVSEEEVAVTSGSNYLIEFLHVSKTNNITLTRTVKTTAKYQSICLMNDTTFLVSTINDKRPLRVITLTGEEKDFIGLEEKQYSVGASSSMYIRNKNIAVLIDRHHHTLYMYNAVRDGVTRRAVKHGDIIEPTGVCVGPGDCLFVCSKGTNSIVQISLCGEVVGSHKQDKESPCTVCMSKDKRKLAVYSSANGNSKLHVFDFLKKANSNITF